MNGMSIQQRYDDIVRISGLSEELVRRVLKASRQSIEESLLKGERATLPGICTLSPEIKSRVNIGGNSVTRYIKVKASASSALETQLAENSSFVIENNDDETEIKLNLINPELPSSNRFGVRTAQVNALL